MPQMSPISWTVLMLFTVLVLMFSLTQLYFNISNLPKPDSSNAYQTYFYWKW